MSSALVSPPRVWGQPCRVHRVLISQGRTSQHSDNGLQRLKETLSRYAGGRWPGLEGSSSIFRVGGAKRGLAAWPIHTFSEVRWKSRSLTAFAQGNLPLGIFPFNCHSMGTPEDRKANRSFSRRNQITNVEPRCLLGNCISLPVAMLAYTWEMTMDPVYGVAAAQKAILRTLSTCKLFNLP